MENSQRLTAIKSTLNQEEYNLETVKIVVVFCFHLYHLFLGGGSLERGSLLPNTQSSVIPQWAEIPYSQRIVFMCSNMSGGYLKTDTKCMTLFCLTELTQRGKVVGIPRRHCNTNEKLAVACG